VNAKMTAWMITIAIALVFVLYDVRFNFVFSLPGKATQVDSAQESLYAVCYETRDRQIHKTAFGTIDNPDVQKEFINTGRARAVRECRNDYPPRVVSVSQPFRMNFIDLHARYW